MRSERESLRVVRVSFKSKVNSYIKHKASQNHTFTKVIVVREILRWN